VDGEHPADILLPVHMRRGTTTGPAPSPTSGKPPSGHQTS